MLLRRHEFRSEGELAANGSKSIGGGDDSGEELGWTSTSVRRLRACFRKAEGGITSSSGGGDDRGDVIGWATVIEWRADLRRTTGTFSLTSASEVSVSVCSSG